MTFTELARDTHEHFDGLNLFDQFELTGAYLLEHHRAPDEIEVLVESLCQGEESEHVIALFKLMEEGVMGQEDCADWAFKLAQMIVKNYSGLVQSAMEKAQEAPFLDEACQLIDEEINDE